MSEIATYEQLRAKAQGSNVDPTTLLATDYLNHLNEPVMLLEMLPDMPDLSDELMAWQPKSYTEHFEESAIADRDLAIEAYPHSPDEYRLPFEFTIRALTRRVETLRTNTIDALSAEDDGKAREIVRTGLSSIHELMGVANAIIHGATQRDDLQTKPTAKPDCASPQGPADVPVSESAEDEIEALMSQDDIDSLFD